MSMQKQQATVLRIGHRKKRDIRVTTHCCLVARALGAKKTIICGEKDLAIKKTIEQVNKNWGNDFKTSFSSDLKKEIKKLKKQSKIIHLTMYGKPIQEKIKEIRKHKKITIVIGSQKVPKEVYNLADYNVSITSQPHSEIAALAIFLHELFEGKELETKKKGKLRIIPQEKGKKVIYKKTIL